MVSDLDLIRPKEKIMSVSFVMDSMPGYILVISKVIQPVALLDNKDNQPSDGIMFRILSVNSSNDEQESA